MRLKSLALALVLAGSTAGLAHAADVIRTFDVNDAVFTDGSRLTGTVQVDTTTGEVLSTDLTDSTYGSLQSSVAQQGYSSIDAEYLIFDYSAASASTEEFRGGLLATSLVGYLGGDFASEANPSPNNYLSDFDVSGVKTSLASGSLVSAAPEPSSWVLMILGMGGIGVAFRQAKRKLGLRFKDAFAA